MSKVRAKNSAVERAVRSEAHRMGFRFRLHRADLPGRPDLVFVAQHKVVFVHGCFWHQHNCRLSRRVPAANRGYWVPKLAKI
jgi:DNA mismatch endonuclease (patch repair protein)